MSKSAPSIRKPTTVWLEGSSEKKMWFCPNCRIPLIEYEGNVIQIVPGGSPYSPSTSLKCKGSVQKRDGTWEECGAFYTFLGVVFTKNPQMT